MCLFFLDLRTAEERARGKSSCAPFVYQFLKCKFAGTGSMTSGWCWLRPLLPPPQPEAVCLLVVFIWLVNLASEVEGQAWELLRPFLFQTAEVTAFWSQSWDRGPILLVLLLLGLLLSLFFFCSVIWNKWLLARTELFSLDWDSLTDVLGDARWENVDYIWYETTAPDITPLWVNSHKVSVQQLISIILGHWILFICWETIDHMVGDHYQKWTKAKEVKTGETEVEV